MVVLLFSAEETYVVLIKENLASNTALNFGIFELFCLSRWYEIIRQVLNFSSKLDKANLCFFLTFDYIAFLYE